jgi:hypothetical protein
VARSDADTYALEIKAVTLVAAILSVSAFLWYFTQNEVLLYGDAVAHINIGRRVFDSGSPGPLQLGTVWLPLPHVLMIPFIVNDWMWRTGIGGSIPSMIAYILGVVGIYRLMRARLSRSTAITAAAIYALNPNLLYMQSTAMTESIFLATVIWSVVYLDDFIASVSPDAASIRDLYPPHGSLEKCAMVLAASILTRYDGWVLAGICGLIVIAALFRNWSTLDAPLKRSLLRSTIAFCLLCALTAILWLSLNYANTANPFDFANGPYSAKAIEARTMHLGQPGHPGTGDLWVSALFFMKAAKLNMAWGAWERWVWAFMLIGTVLVLRTWKSHGVLLLLWFVLPFYAYSVAYGSVPIFIPAWWPHSYYNVRYGLELLPAFAVFLAIAITYASSWFGRKGRQCVTLALFLLLIGGSYLNVARATPICLREARVNSVDRIRLEERLAAELRNLPPNSSILMFTGEYVGALQRDGIHLRRVISEAIHPDWDLALVAPAQYADYVVTAKGDPVSYAVRLFPADLEKIAEFDTPGKPTVTLYRSTSARP